MIISKLCIHGYHGVKEAEKSLGQKFYLDVICGIDRAPNAPDQMSTTVCYDEICNLIVDISSAETFNLIESFAEQIITVIFERFSIVNSVDLTIQKPNAPIHHKVDYVGVSVARKRLASA